VIEVEPETLWVQVDDEESPYRFAPGALEQLCGFRQRKLVHGVGFPVGGSRRPDQRHVPLFRSAIEELSSPWASEHLSFNEASDAGSHNAYTTSFLLPPRQTVEGAATAAHEIRALARRLPVPFAVETGVNYLQPRADELGDGAFIAEVVRRAGCGILLDLHNIWINEQNGRQAVDDLLAELPLERIWEIHLAGGFELDGYLIDAHSGAIPEELLELAERVVPLLPNLHAIDFELLPDFFPRFGIDGVRDQLRLIWKLWETRGSRADASARRPLLQNGGEASSVGPREWETALGRLVVGADPETALEEELASDPGVALLQSLVGQFRSGRIVSALPLTTRLLLLSIGSEPFRTLLGSFWSVTRPERFATVEAEEFASFLLARNLDVEYLEDTVALDLATLRAQTGRVPGEALLSHDPHELMAALQNGRSPDAVPAGTFRVLVTSEDAVDA
jgi:uncharacterized protein